MKYGIISLITGISYPAQMNIASEKKIMDLENRLVAAQWEREGVEGSGAWGYQIQLRIDLQGDPAE